MTRDSKAVWQPSPNYWPGRNGYRPTAVIVHGTAGNGAVSWLTNTASEASAHYVIQQDASIYQLVDENDSAWANGGVSGPAASSYNQTGYGNGYHDPYWSTAVNPNYQTISIEHQKADSANASQLTAAQQAASFALISRICARWNIPAKWLGDSGGISGHYSMDPVNRSDCPGVYPWQALYNYLAAMNGGSPTMLQIGSGIGSHFKDLGGTPDKWHCVTTNVDLIGANLDFYRTYEGIGGLPLTNEIYLAKYPGTAIVACERWIQCYDPKRIIDNPPQSGAVYLLHVDEGIGQQMIAKPLVVSLNAKIAALQSQVADLQKNESSSALETQIASYKQALQAILTTIQNAEK